MVPSFRQPSHGAVVVHDLADHRRRVQSRLAGDIHRCLGMAGSDQRAAFPSQQRKHVAGRGDIVASRVGVDRHGDGLGAIGGGDTGGNALPRFDRHGERRLVPGAVLLAHQRQAKLFHPVLGQGEADQAARVPRHEVDRVRRRELRGDHEIAFVFTVLVIYQDEHAAVAGFLDQFLGRGQILGQFRGDELLVQVFHQAVSARRAT
jgi:hypothetical protein